MAIADEISDKLNKAFAPTLLNVVNESHLHAGHSGDDGSGESHFNIEIAAPAFADMNRIARHRAVHAALGPEVIGKIHALSLDIS